MTTGPDHPTPKPTVEYYRRRRQVSERYFDDYHGWKRDQDLSFAFRTLAIALVVMTLLAGCLVFLLVP
jgi:hypothetical protein